MKAQQKKLSGCASNLLAQEDLGHFEEAHHWNIQAKFYIEKFALVYESDNIRDSLYEEHGATLKHKCGKRIVTLPLLSFSLFFVFSFFGGLLWPLFFVFLGNALIMMIITLLFTYNSKITTQYLEQNMTLYECSGGVPGCAMNKE